MWNAEPRPHLEEEEAPPAGRQVLPTDAVEIPCT